MPKVYVIQENPRLTYEDAERFGEVVFMTVHEFRPMANSLQNDQICSEISRKLADFNPEEDYLLMTGNPITMGLVFAALARKCDIITCLQWKRDRCEYSAVQVKPSCISPD